MHRFRTLPLILGYLAWIGPSVAAADELYIAGPDGKVMVADATVGIFSEFTCLCAGPITSMAHDGQHLFVGDAFGSVLAFDAKTGALEYTFMLPAPSTAMIVQNQDLIVALDDQTVRRVDRVSGVVKDTRPVPTTVHALVRKGAFLYVAGEDGAVYRGPVSTGEFAYFTCFCFFQIKALVVDGDHLIAGDSLGLVGRIDVLTGLIDFAYFFPGPLNSLALQGEDVLAHIGGGIIERADSETGPTGPGSYYLSPIDVGTMLVVSDPPFKNGTLLVNSGPLIRKP